MSFCPLIKETCKGNQCTMWLDEKCLVVNFLSQPLFTAIDDDIGLEIDLPVSSTSGVTYGSSRSTQTPSWVKDASPEDIVSEYVRYMDREFPDSEPYNVWSIFLRSIGCYYDYNMAPEIELKLQKARILAETESDKRREVKLQLRRDQEFATMDSLVDQ